MTTIGAPEVGIVIERLKHMLRVQHQANCAILGAIADQDRDMLDAMQHVIQCEHSYLLRWNGGPPPEGTHAAWSLAECRQSEAQVATAWQEWLSEISEADLAWRLERITASGPFSLDAVDMVIHVVAHGFHHRAQVSAMLRSQGREPPRTGYAYLAGYGLADEPD